MDKTYCETEGHKAFDWNLALDQAIAGELNHYERTQLEVKAAEWTTCACGNQCAIIPRAEQGQPLDPLLYRLGLDFMDNIDHAYYQEAKEILQQIEQRSSQLIKQELQKLNTK